MDLLISSFIGGFIACSISVLIASRLFYNLGKKHGAKIREREVILELIEEMERKYGGGNQSKL